jgi:MYB-related transcription factor LHY
VKVNVGGRWSDAEHRRFLEGLKMYGKDWRLIEEHIGTRTCSQIRSHAQKYFLRYDKVDCSKNKNDSNQLQDQPTQHPAETELKPKRRSNMFADIDDMPDRPSERPVKQYIKRRIIDPE